MKNKAIDLIERVSKKYTDHQLIERFNLRPMRWLQNEYVKTGTKITVDEAINPEYDLTPVIYTDLRHSALTEQDANVQIIGSGGSGKSASGIHFKEADYKLKGRFIDYGDGKGNYSLNKFIDEIKPNALQFMKHLRSPELQKYDNALLDEAGQNVREGALSHSLDAYLNDIEQVMRAKCITKFFCSWGLTTNSYQYVLETWDINRRKSELELLLFAPPSFAYKEEGKFILLGHVRIPFPDKRIYDAYFNKKMKGIDNKLIGTNELAEEKYEIAETLKLNAEYQLMNKAQKVNWIERHHPQFLTRSTWVNEIEQMAHIPTPIKHKLQEIVLNDGFKAGDDYLEEMFKAENKAVLASQIAVKREENKK